MHPELQDQTLREHPSATKCRLIKSGEWPDADRLLRKVKQSLHRQYKKAGGSLTLERRVQLAREAWDAVHDRWPPPEGTAPLKSLLEYVHETQGPGRAGLAMLPRVSMAAERRFEEIGETDDLTGDAVWVYHNLDNASVDPLEAPSRGAWSLLIHAREDKDKFYRQYLKPAIAETSRRSSKDAECEYKPSKAERLAVAELDQMIREAEAASQLITCPNCTHAFRPGMAATVTHA